jgi:hypothetical protein
MSGRYGGNSYPGMGLMDALDAGNDRRIKSGQYDSEMQNEALRRLLDSQKGARDQEMHPLEMQGKGLANTGQGILNEKNQQAISIEAQQEARAQSKYEQEEIDKFHKDLPNIAAQIESYPPEMQYSVAEGLLSARKGSKMYMDALKKGIEQGHVKPTEIGANMRRNAELQARMRPEHIQATDVAKIGDERARAVAETQANARVRDAEIGANARIRDQQIRSAADAAEQGRKQQHDAMMADKKNAHKLEQIQKAADARREASIAIEKAKQAGPTKASKESIENAIVRMQGELRKPDLPAEAIREIQIAINELAEMKIAFASAGKDQTSPGLSSENGKLTITQEPRRADPPKVTGGKGTDYKSKYGLE